MRIADQPLVKAKPEDTLPGIRRVRELVAELASLCDALNAIGAEVFLTNIGRIERGEQLKDALVIRLPPPN